MQEVKYGLQNIAELRYYDYIPFSLIDIVHSIPFYTIKSMVNSGYNAFTLQPYKPEFIDSLREDTSVSNEHSDNSNCKQMRRIIEIEKPFHAFPFSPLTVILLQNR